VPGLCVSNAGSNSTAFCVGQAHVRTLPSRPPHEGPKNKMVLTRLGAVEPQYFSRVPRPIEEGVKQPLVGSFVVSKYSYGLAWLP
jgi:hypothetical protein